VRLLLLGLATLAIGLCQQAANNIFSGTVTALTADSVTVVRKVPAKADVSRKFTLDAQTRVEGPPLKIKARVTVRYRTSGDGQFQALNVIVR
jgi:hypothetical protein